MKKLSLIFCSSLLTFSAAAQVVGGSSFFSEIVSDWHMGFTADTMGMVALPANVGDDGSGDLSVYETSASLKFQGAHQGKQYVTIDAGYKYSYYDFSDYASDFSSVNKAFARMFFQHNVDEKWSVFSTVMGAFAASSNGDLSEGGNFLGGVGGAYAFSEDLTLGLGVAAYYRMDKDWIPLPIGYLNWTINKHLSLRTFSGVALIYDVFADGTFLVNFTAEYSNSYIRLKSSGGSKQSVCDSYMQIGVGATYHITPKWYVSGTVAGNFWREINYRVGGDKAQELDVDSAPVFILHFGYMF